MDFEERETLRRNLGNLECTVEQITNANQGVREPPILRHEASGPKDVLKCPAHPSDRRVAQLNETWKVVDGPLQWELQRRKGNQRDKNSGWQGRSFCRTREGLLRCVREYCGEISVEAVSKLQALPVWHLDWYRKTHFQNLDAVGTDPHRADE